MDIKGARLGTVPSSRFGGRMFLSTGLKVCILTDCLCRGLSSHITDTALTLIKPGATLSRSLLRHARLIDRVEGGKVVVIHVGTEDVRRGTTPDDYLTKMLALIHRIQRGSKEQVYFGVCSVLPRPTDDLQTNFLVHGCNALMQRASEQMQETVCYLQTDRLFLKGLFMNVVDRDYYTEDGLHLNARGKTKLFTWINNFLECMQGLKF